MLVIKLVINNLGLHFAIFSHFSNNSFLLYFTKVFLSDGLEKLRTSSSRVTWEAAFLEEANFENIMGL